jgi:hypothetical protein
MRKKLLTAYILAFGLFLSPPSTGQATVSKTASSKATLSCLNVLKIFQDQSACYVKGFCSENIFNFVKELSQHKPKIDLSDTEVLILYAGRNVPALTKADGFLIDNRAYYWPLGTRFTPLTSRHQPPSTWNYHVILRHQRQIYDFDHSRDLKALPMAVYFREMYGAEFNKLSPYRYTETLAKLSSDLFPKPPLILYVKVVPAQVYLEQFLSINLLDPESSRRTPIDWLNPEKAPLGRTLESYLREKLLPKTF